MLEPELAGGEHGTCSGFLFQLLLGPQGTKPSLAPVKRD